MANRRAEEAIVDGAVRVPRIDTWAVVGDLGDPAAHVTYHRVPVHWWILDQWLARSHPHWAWWNRLWNRLLPGWGDPFCAAYCTRWTTFYWTRREDETWIQVSWDELPAPIRAAFEGDRHDRSRIERDA